MSTPSTDLTPASGPVPEAQLLADLARAGLELACGAHVLDWDALPPVLADDPAPIRELITHALHAAACALLRQLSHDTSEQLRDLLTHADNLDGAATRATQLVATIEITTTATHELATALTAVRERLAHDVLGLTAPPAALPAPDRARLALLRPLVCYSCAQHGVRVHWQRLVDRLAAADPATACLTGMIGHAARYAALHTVDTPLAAALRDATSRQLTTDLDALRDTGLFTAPRP